MKIRIALPIAPIATIATIALCGIVFVGGCLPDQSDDPGTVVVPETSTTKQADNADSTEPADVELSSASDTVRRFAPETPLQTQMDTTEPANDELPTLDQVVDENDVAVDEDEFEERHTIPIPDTWTRLSEKNEIWVDLKKDKKVIAGGEILSLIHI